MTKTTTAIVSLAAAATAMMAANTANAQLVAQTNVDFESVRQQRNLASSISSSHARRRLMPIDCPADQYPVYVQVAFQGTGPIDLIWTVTGDTVGTVLEGKSDNTLTTQYFTQHTEVVCVPETECGNLDLSANGASLSENLVELFLGVGQPDDFNSPTASPTSSSKKGKGSGKGKGKSSSDDSSPLDDISSIRLTSDDIVTDDSAKTGADPLPTAQLNFCAGEVIGGDIIDANGNTIFDISNAPSLAPSVSAEPSASPAPTAKSGKSSKGKGKSDDRRLHQNRSRGRRLTKN